MLLGGVLLAACAALPTCGPGVPSPCASPTPVVTWDQVADADLDGYEIRYRVTGATTWTPLVTIPCQRWMDDDGLAFRLCRAPDAPIPLQRYPQLAAGTSYDICVVAYDQAGNRSGACSAPLTVCMPPVYPGKPAVYQ